MSDESAHSHRPLEAVFYRDDELLARCLIQTGRFSIGHEGRNDIVLHEPSISGKHARLRVRSEEDISIEDLSSANGTRVNGHAVTGETQVTFEDQIQLGTLELRFERAGLPAAVFRELPLSFLCPQRHDLGEAVVQGSTSTIYQAHDTSLGREVAMKVLLPGSQRDPAAVLRFVREAQITAQLPHPGILPIYELGTNDDGALFFTTRFIEGESLNSILERLEAADERALERHRFLSLIQVWQKVCDAVAYAHSRGIVHTALTPDVIEVGRFGEVFVTMWSFALTLPEKARVHAPAAGSLPPLNRYQSPEQASGQVDDIDERSDVFALGGLLYRIVTLSHPLQGETEDALLEAALKASVTPPATLTKDSPRPHWPRSRHPEFLSAVAMKALSYAREDRHQSVAELQREVGVWLEESAGGTDLGAAVWKQFTGLLRPH